MADVFISYAREDKEFVERLAKGLEVRDRTPWVDWTGIPPTADFMQEILRAIEGTNTFIFVLSPDSIASKVCGMEIAHAVARNKRMVPLVARDVEDGRVPESLAKLNYIFCRETDDFEAKVGELIITLDTDLDWVRAHTRLLTRAVEWETKGKNNSFVLRGDDLRAAEQWLTEAGSDNERQPTALQTEYIIASRKAAARAQRMLLGASATAAAVAIILAALAWNQREKAVTSASIAKKNEEEATRQRNTAVDTLSRSYFAEANRLAEEGQGAQALAYCAAAVRNNGHQPAATRIATLLTDRVWPRPQQIQRVENAVRAWFAPDGCHVVALLADGSVEIRDAATAKPLAQPIRLASAIDGVWFSPDGARVVIASEVAGEVEKAQSSLQRFECQNGRAIGAPIAAIGGIDGVSFSPDSRRFIVSDAASLFACDAESGKVLWKGPRAESVRFSADGKRLVTTVHEEGAQVRDAKNGAPVGKRIVGDDEWQVESAALSPDGTRVVTGCTSISEEGAIRIWEVPSGKPLSGWIEREYNVNEVAFSPDGAWVLAVTRTAAHVCDVAGKALQPAFRLPNNEGVKSASFSPEGERVAIGGSDGGVGVWDVRTGRIAAEFWTQRGLETIAFTADGRAIATTSDQQRERQVHLVLAGIGRPAPLDDLSLHNEDGPLLLFIDIVDDVSGEGRKRAVRVRNIDTGKTVFETAIGTGKAHVAATAFSHDRARMALAFGKTVKMWDLFSMKELPEFRHQQEVVSLEFHPGGEKILTGAGTAMVWEVATGKQLFELKAPAPVNSARFVPDGTSIVTVSDDGTAQVWNADSGALGGESKGKPGKVVSQKFSADGKRVVIHEADDHKGWVRLLDTTTGQPLVEPIATGTQPEAVTLSADGSRLAVASGKTLRIIDFGSCADAFPAVPLSDLESEVSFSADSRWFATVGDAFQIWNAATGQPALNATKPVVSARSEARFERVSFSPDSRWLVASAIIGHHEAEASSIRLYDLLTGEPLSDVREMRPYDGKARFTLDGHRLVLGAGQWLWEVPPSATPPSWLPTLAEAVGGVRLDARGIVGPLENQPQVLADMATSLLAKDEHDPWVQLGQWFFSEWKARAVAPGSAMTVSDYVARGLRSDDVDELEEILRVAPDQAALHAKLGEKWLAKEEQFGAEAKMRADRASLLATLLEPKSSDVWKSRARVLQALKRRQEAGQAAAKAASLGAR